MTRKARFRVLGRLDQAGRPTEGTVTIDRDLGLFEVRPLRRRRTYTVPLATVATMVVQGIIRVEERERRKARKARRGRRSR